jgi:hypothetical protein
MGRVRSQKSIGGVVVVALGNAPYSDADCTQNTIGMLGYPVGSKLHTSI